MNHSLNLSINYVVRKMNSHLIFHYLVSLQLSEASKQTLIHQGGPMSAEEAGKFEKLPVFHALIQMRKWDDEGKVEGLPIEPLSKYEEMCTHYLRSFGHKNK